MAILGVNNLRGGIRRQRGMSLIEMMIAATLGLTILVSVGTTFIAGQRMANDKQQKLLLNQNMTDALKYIAEDSRRAGYNASNGHTLMLTGTGVNSVLHLERDEKNTPTVDDDDEFTFSYTYRIENQYQITSFWGDRSSGKLMVCSRRLSHPAALSDCDKTIHYESLMDERRILMTGFKITETKLGTENKTAYFSVSLAACIKQDMQCKSEDPDLHKWRDINFKQRNWQ